MVRPRTDCEKCNRLLFANACQVGSSLEAPVADMKQEFFTPLLESAVLGHDFPRKDNARRAYNENDARTLFNPQDATSPSGTRSVCYGAAILLARTASMAQRAHVNRYVDWVSWELGSDAMPIETGDKYYGFGTGSCKFIVQR